MKCCLALRCAGVVWVVLLSGWAVGAILGSSRKIIKKKFRC